MELQRAKILLEKINALYRSIDLDEGKIAHIERDLMLNYIRQLYEIFLQTETGPAAASPAAQPRREASADPGEQARPQPEPLKRTYKPPRIIEIPEINQQQTPPPPPQPAPPPAPPRQEVPATRQPEPPRPEPEPVRNEQAPAPSHRPELESLFEQKKATELSEKLSESPVGDLTRAMAINDRLLFMNELFGRNMNILDETLRQLNRFQTMAEAKPLLTTLAERYNWMEEEKLDIAKGFIKLVRRRYI